MTLQILISTYGNRIANVPNVLMSPTTNVTYIVSWQKEFSSNYGRIPQSLLDRKDVMVIETNERGGAFNRNNCINHADADICLVADDDLRYEPNAFEKIISIFEENTNIDIALFQYSSDCEKRIYPPKRINLKNKISGYSPVAFEIAFRKSSVKGKLQFNELFGINAPELDSGEDDVFIFEALKMGLVCEFFPITITKHIGPTTINSRSDNPKVLMARGAYLYLAYRTTMYLRAIRISQLLSQNKKSGFFHSLKYLIKGILYIKDNYHKKQ